MKTTVFLLLVVGIHFVTLSELALYAVDKSAQNDPTDPVTRMNSWEYHVKLKNESMFRDMKWRTVGPAFQGGRIESIACTSGYTSTIYVGVGAGNLCKSENNGTTWRPIFENESTFAIGSVAISGSNPDIVWVGTGEILVARSSYAGAGVFKSADGGRAKINVGDIEFWGDKFKDAVDTKTNSQVGAGLTVLKLAGEGISTIHSRNVDFAAAAVLDGCADDLAPTGPFCWQL